MISTLQLTGATQVDGLFAGMIFHQNNNPWRDPVDKGKPFCPSELETQRFKVNSYAEWRDHFLTGGPSLSPLLGKHQFFLRASEEETSSCLLKEQQQQSVSELLQQPVFGRGTRSMENPLRDQWSITLSSLSRPLRQIQVKKKTQPALPLHQHTLCYTEHLIFYYNDGN